jgi:nicotinamidase-related amidase
MAVYTLQLLFAACSVTVLLFGIYLARSMFIPTRGVRIDTYTSPKKALLVLDIQESGAAPDVAFPAQTPLGKMITSVNKLINCFDSTGQEVIYIRQVFRSSLLTRLHGGRILAGQMEPRLSRWLNIVNGNDFPKNRTDAFSNRQLEHFLIERQVNELYLVGLDAAFCVYYTALGALSRGYRVTVVSDGVMTGRDMGKVLERYSAHNIAVISSAELLTALNCELQEIKQLNRVQNSTQKLKGEHCRHGIDGHV